MKRRRLDLSPLVPPGYDWKRPLYWLLAACGLGLLYSLRFLADWGRARDSLFQNGLLRPDAVMPDFSALFRPVGGYFAAVALAFLLAGVVLLAAYGRRGARSDYTMRRLPQRFERLRRLTALPALACLATLLLGFLLMLLYFLIYMKRTPAVCIPPEQWAKIWRF